MFSELTVWEISWNKAVMRSLCELSTILLKMDQVVYGLGVIMYLTPPIFLGGAGASHHFWTHPSKPTDSPEVVRARETIWRQVTAWLGEDD